MSVNITFTNITQIFEDHEPKVTALTDVSLQIQAGEFVAIVGPSGCGKSTLLRIASDLLSPTSGEVHVGEKPAQRARKDRDVGFIFQRPALFPWRTVKQNVQLPAEINGHLDAMARVDDLINLVGLSEFQDALPRQLSGGMQARVALARALCVSPNVLLLDEPFASLDEFTREKMQTELSLICEKMKITVVFATHSLTEAVFLSDRVVGLSDRPGTIRYDVTVPFTRPRSHEIKNSKKFIEFVDELKQKLQ